MTTIRMTRRVRDSWVRRAIKTLIQGMLVFVAVVAMFYVWCESAVDRGNYYREMVVEENGNDIVIEDTVVSSYGR